MKVLIGVNEVEQLLSNKNSYKIFKFASHFYKEKGTDAKFASEELNVCQKTVHTYKNRLINIAEVENEYYFWLDFTDDERKNYLLTIFTYIFAKKWIKDEEKNIKYKQGLRATIKWYDYRDPHDLKLNISVNYLSKLLNCSTNYTNKLKKDAKKMNIIKVSHTFYKGKQLRDRIRLISNYIIKYDVQLKRKHTFFNLITYSEPEDF